MVKTSRLVWGLLLTSGLAACAGVEVGPVANPMTPAPLPQYKVGDRFVFEVAIVKDRQTVVAVDEKKVTIKSSVFGTLTQHKDFGNPESWTGGLTQAYSTTPDKILSGLFPLRVGNRVSGTGSYSYNSKGTYARTCVVQDQVRVTVPAGNFDTYKIQCKMDYIYPNGTSSDKDRYSPAVNHWVAINRHGRLFVLLSFKKT